jgi:hypothetical protein
VDVHRARRRAAQQAADHVVDRGVPRVGVVRRVAEGRRGVQAAAQRRRARRRHRAAQRPEVVVRLGGVGADGGDELDLRGVGVGLHAAGALGQDERVEHPDALVREREVRPAGEQQLLLDAEGERGAGAEADGPRGVGHAA